MVKTYIFFKVVYIHESQFIILGLDPARPLINKYGSKYFRLTKDDAHLVQIIHTNAGFLGDVDKIGHVDFCVNGGQNQPGCKGHIIRRFIMICQKLYNLLIAILGRARCSHFQSACYFAATIRNGNALLGRPCTKKCPKMRNTGLLPGPSIPMGEDTPDE